MQKNQEIYQNPLATVRKIQELEEALEDSQRQRKQMERLLKFLRERAEGSKLESQHLQKDLKIAQDTIASLTQQYKTAKDKLGKQPPGLSQNSIQSPVQNPQDVQDSQEELLALRLQFKALKDQIQVGKKQILLLQEQIDNQKGQNSDTFQASEELKSAKRQIHELQSQIELLNRINQSSDNTKEQRVQLQAELAAVQQSKHLLETALQNDRSELQHARIELQNAKNALEEREQNFKFAQQHLAKKMKDASYFSDKVEEQKIQISELQKSLVESQAKAAILQQGVDNQIQHEKHIQDQLKETMKTSENQAKKWEEKYFQLHDKWQEAESQLKNLKSLESRHNQMQALLGNLGSLMTTATHPQMPPQAIHELNVSLPSLPMQQNHSAGAQLSEKQNSLFQAPEPAIRFKQTLFD